MHMYSDLAPWFHLLTHPSDYRDEAAFVTRVVDEVVEDRSGRCSSSARAEATTPRT